MTTINQYSFAPRGSRPHFRQPQRSLQDQSHSTTAGTPTGPGTADRTANCCRLPNRPTAQPPSRGHQPPAAQCWSPAVERHLRIGPGPRVLAPSITPAAAEERTPPFCLAPPPAALTR